MSRNRAAPDPDFQNAKGYRSAIAALEDSTRAFEKHIDAARRLESSGFVATKSTLRSTKHSPLGQQQQQLRLLDSVRLETQDGHRTSSNGLQNGIATTVIITDDTLSRHDHTFDLIENAQSSHLSSAVSDDNAAQTQKLLLALQQTQSEIVRTRLNRTYLEALQVNDYDINGHNGDLRSSADADVELVKADLKALHAEINDVAQMLVSHEHGEVLAAISLNLREAQSTLQQQHIRNTTEQISNMTQQLEMITERAEMLQSHRIVLQRLAKHLKDNSSTQTIQRPISKGQLAADLPRKDTSSLAALQHYLGLAHASAAPVATSEQIDLAFDDFVSHVSSSIVIQDEQARTMRCATKTPDIGMDDNYNRGNIVQSWSLDDLENEIAEIKAVMDASSS